jgi:hypothetical protein
LRTTVRVEPAAASWIKISAEFARGPIVTVDQTDLPIEVHIPETFDTPPSATLVLDSNGGTQRVEVRLERPAAPEVIPDAPAALDSHVGVNLRGLIARQPVQLRLITWSLGAILLRVLILAASVLVGPGSEQARPPLRAVAVVLAVLGGVLGARFAWKHGELRDLPTVGFAGGIMGVLAATLLVAACRTLEPILGPGLSASSLVVCLLWGAVGAALAAGSAVLAPPQPGSEGSS